MFITTIELENKKYDVFEYGRNGTKAPKMWVLVDKISGKRLTPYAQRHHSIKFNLNAMFKIIYSRQLRDFIPDGIKLLSKIPKDKSYNSLYHVPVILGEQHGVIKKEKDNDEV